MMKVILVYFIFLLSFFSIFSSGAIDSIDGLQYLAVSRNIYYNHEPTAPLYEYATRENLHLSSFVAANGKTYSMTGLGFSMAYLPAVFITDMVYKFYSLNPLNHFPLQSDWLILFLASFVNSFFASGLGVILFLYFNLLKVNIRNALLLSFIAIVGTNLFVYAKHSFAHMAFIFFMMLSFLLIKYYSIKKDKWILFFAGVSFGVLSIVYNQTFLLTLVPLLFYFFLLTRKEIKRNRINYLKSLLFGFLGFLPFVFIYFWYENLRSLPEQNFAGTDFYITYAAHSVSFPIGVFIEALHGQLLSPGRSIFLYSPLLIIIIFFWSRIKSQIKPEFFAFLLISAIYILFYSVQYRVGAPDQGIIGNWHGELSWGPRYLTPLIPLGMIIVGMIYLELSNRVKLFIFYPLLFLGLFINLLGMVLPYQIKLHDMQQKIFLNGTEYYSSLYSDFLPRYNPILTMAKKVYGTAKNFPNYMRAGEYNLSFYDGIDFTFPVGGERWRVIEGNGYIRFDSAPDTPREISLGLINHPIEESSASAQIQININGTDILEKPAILLIGDRKTVTAKIPGNILNEKNNEMVIKSTFNEDVLIRFDKNPNVVTAKKQILALMSFDINGKRQNLESISVPFVSSLGPAMTGVQYKNWGEENIDPWRIWDIHTQTYERIFDFWWIRNLFYWDIPKNLIIGLFVLNILTLIISGFTLFKNFKR